MKSQNLKTNAHGVRTGILQSDFAEERGKNGPTPAEIRQRAFEIHVERGGDGCDLENYLDDWRQAGTRAPGKIQQELSRVTRKTKPEGGTNASRTEE